MDDILILTQMQIAAELEISVDTLRNWQKQGVVCGSITKADIASIKERLCAQGRLSSRANKLYKRGKVTKINHWSEYESSLEESHRNREGIYYTPQDIVQNMFSTIPVEGVEDKLFLDPCCGSGNFLVAALEMGFRAENIYGFDMDGDAVKIARQRVPKAKIRCGDFLDLARRMRRRYDYIYTNPPWGKRLSKGQRAEYTEFYDTPRTADSSALFIIASQRVLKDGGKMGFLVQEAVFNIGTFEWLRRRLLSLKVECLKDYGRPFKGLVTGAQGVVVENRMAQSGDRCWCNFRHECQMRDVSSFAKLPKGVMNFWATEHDMQIIESIYAHPHKTLNEPTTRWGLGIVTGDNDRFCCSEKIDSECVGVVRGSDISARGISTPTSYISRDLTQYQQYASAQIYEAEVKLIYRFISSKLVFFADREQRYPLNSANCVVVADDFGATSEQIAELLNSEVMNWLFEKLYRSHKILRGDIETMPLHIDYFEKYTHFSEEDYCKHLQIKQVEGGYEKI
ncbi:MAG: TaqI-like C-terminal specificity domain-containing protein [Rikenellaceae bacterium]